MNFYADWDYDTYKPNTLRKGTRIYWGQGHHTQNTGRCIGTFIGENPGAAHASQRKTGWDTLVEGNSSRPGDKTLRFVHQAWNAAAQAVKRCPQEDDYIEVLNTYYFRCPASGQQLAEWRAAGGNAVYFQAVSQASKFVILGWGKAINKEPECCALRATLVAGPVIIAQVNGSVQIVASPVSHPLQLYPAQPSAIAQRGNNPAFLSNLSRILAPFI